ncbi:MAG: hypothetical protein U5L09_05810 [Bacteroidales bacterium]|nr:hypothetical protein [Bacteroidales bacterium]
MENYRNVDHTTREYHEIEKNWKEYGITPEKHLAFYCGTGWRGSEAFINALPDGVPQHSCLWRRMDGVEQPSRKPQ